MNPQRRFTAIASWIALLTLFPITSMAVEGGIVVHEWGTFTSLQDETGSAIGGINTDDEPVPEFVHRIEHRLLLSPNEIRNRFAQGVPQCHPDVTMRLETPVVYFHLPKGDPALRSLDVHVQFRGGWLTEFYPHAVADAPGIHGDHRRMGPYRYGPLEAGTIGTLRWNQLTAGGNWPLTNSTEHVWTSPRAVQASLVLATNGEAEKFLFYRGVGHLDAPLRVSRDFKSDQLVIRGQLRIPTETPLRIPHLWLVDIRKDGLLAYRSLSGLSLDSTHQNFLARTAATFERKEYSFRNLVRLRAALRDKLVEDGLFRDEADALLNTWELSYFKSAGLRLFFLVPKEWTDHYLPLEISGAPPITRVMVGRIELITPEQRQLLGKIAGYSPRLIDWASGSLSTNFYRAATAHPDSHKKIWASSKPMNAHFAVPEPYQTYLDLGRFRNALILHAAKETPALTNFISRFGLHAYRPSPFRDHNTDPAPARDDRAGNHR